MCFISNKIQDNRQNSLLGSRIKNPYEQSYIYRLDSDCKYNDYYFIPNLTILWNFRGHFDLIEAIPSSKKVQMPVHEYLTILLKNIFTSFLKSYGVSRNDPVHNHVMDSDRRLPKILKYSV